MEKNVNSEALWQRVEQLKGESVTTVRAEIRVYEVTDDKVWFDPVSTGTHGKQWVKRDWIIRLCDEIESGRRRPPDTVTGLQELCEELGIRGAEYVYSYLFAILCAIHVIRHERAGRVSN